MLDAIQAWVCMTDGVRVAMDDGDVARIGELMDRNFDTRVELGGVNDGNRELVRLARSVGASAKLTGSGGAIIGTYADDDMFARLSDACAPHDIKVIKPELTPTREDHA